VARTSPAPASPATHQLPPSPAPRQQRLLEHLRKAQHELSAQDLHQLLEAAQEPQGLATVYRGLKLLQRAGLLRSRKLADGETLYAPLERDQHHLICVNCGSTELLPSCPFDSGTKELTRVLLEGFSPLFHTFEVHGFCARCQPLKTASLG